MGTQIITNKTQIIILSIVSICISGLFAMINISEFFVIGVLDQTDEYPFGGEGDTPYYYATSRLYATVSLVWGILFLLNLLFAGNAMFRLNIRNAFLAFGLGLLLLIIKFIHGLIG